MSHHTTATGTNGYLQGNGFLLFLHILVYFMSMDLWSSLVIVGVGSGVGGSIQFLYWFTYTEQLFKYLIKYKQILYHTAWCSTEEWRILIVCSSVNLRLYFLLQHHPFCSAYTNRFLAACSLSSKSIICCTYMSKTLDLLETHPVIILGVTIAPNGCRIEHIMYNHIMIYRS